MKRLLLALFVLASVTVGRGAAGAGPPPGDDAPLRVRQTVEPVFPRALMGEGVTAGWVRLVIDVDADGKLADTLVVGHTRSEFGDAAITAMRQWEFFPMVSNGRAVASQTMIGFDFEAKGVVVNVTPDMDAISLAFRGHLEKIYRPSTMAELDNIPVPLVWVDPMFPADLEKRGIVGSATVEFYIDEAGTVRMPAVVRADFPELGHLLSEAVRQWKFEPPTRRGKRVLVHASQTVTFGKADD